jgi:hypothetical protein
MIDAPLDHIVSVALGAGLVAAVSTILLGTRRDTSVAMNATGAGISEAIAFAAPV